MSASALAAGVRNSLSIHYHNKIYHDNDKTTKKKTKKYKLFNNSFNNLLIKFKCFLSK